MQLEVIEDSPVVRLVLTDGKLSFWLAYLEGVDCRVSWQNWPEGYWADEQR